MVEPVKEKLSFTKTQIDLIFDGLMPENFASGDEEEPARLLPSSILKILFRRQVHEVVTRRDPFRLTSVVYLLVQTSQRSKS